MATQTGNNNKKIKRPKTIEEMNEHLEKVEINIQRG